jgi:hypothetical protein
VAAVNTYEYDDNRLPRWLLIAAAGVAAFVLLVAGIAIGRASAPSAATSSRASTAAGQAGPGPTRTVNGVPLGYAHTEAGAVAAATNFLMIMDGPLVAQPDRYGSVIDAMADPNAASTVRRIADANVAVSGVFAASTARGRKVVHRSVPLAYHVDIYASDRAQVSVWEEALIAIDGTLSLRETWSTTAVTVHWVDGDWKLAATAAPTTGSVGPAPTITQPAAQDLSLLPQLDRYRSYQIDVAP